MATTVEAAHCKNTVSKEHSLDCLGMSGVSEVINKELLHFSVCSGRESHHVCFGVP